jgi:hypothetical protein
VINNSNITKEGQLAMDIKGFYVENVQFKGTVEDLIGGDIFNILKDMELANDINYEDIISSSSILVGKIHFISRHHI